MRDRATRQFTRPPRGRLPYVSRQILLSRGEFVFFCALRRALLNRYLITFKVRAADVLSCSDQAWQKGFGHLIARHHVDFVLCTYEKAEIVLVIELDDKSHIELRRKNRDKFLNRAFTAANVPLIRFRATARYDISLIRRTIEDTIRFAAA